MNIIIQTIPQSKMIIISDLNGTYKLNNLMNNINLENNINFVGYYSSPEISYIE